MQHRRPGFCGSARRTSGIAGGRRDRPSLPEVHPAEALPVHPALLGSNEHRLPGSRSAWSPAERTTCARWPMPQGVDLLALDDQVRARTGCAPGTIPPLWHRAKQEVHPARRAALRRPGRPAARRAAGPLGQMPGARPRQHALGRRHRRRRAGRHRARPGQRARRGASSPSRPTRAAWRGAASSSRSAPRTTRRTRSEPFDKHPEMVLQARRHRLLRRQLERQGDQPPRHRASS